MFCSTWWGWWVAQVFVDEKGWVAVEYRGMGFGKADVAAADPGNSSTLAGLLEWILSKPTKGDPPDNGNRGSVLVLSSADSPGIFILEIESKDAK